MKRSWIGLFLLLLLLALSITVTVFMVRIHDPIEMELDQAARLALEGDWNRAEQAFRRADESWQKWSHFRACFADHTPMEEIDAGLRLLETYCATRENAAFAAESRRLAKQAGAMGEAHEFVLWTIF